MLDLSDYLKRYFNQSAIILIDKYDTLLKSGYLNGYSEDIIDFMRSLLVKGFKGNKALKRGVLTGTMRVAHESVFSDFNNPLVSTVLSHTFQENFGFTESEINQIIEDHNLEESMEHTKLCFSF